jgi:cell division protein FtsQ
MTMTSDTRTRFTRRQWQRRLSSMRPLLIALLVVVLVAFAGWVAFFSSWLAASSVEISGDETITREQILEAADVDLGTPLMRLDIDAIQQRVAAMPAVAAVTVHRSWPHTVSIEVTERRPIAAVRQQGSWWVMDGAGVVFRRTDGREPSLPAVQVRTTSAAEALPEVAGVIQALPEDLMAEVQRITARSMDSITLRLDGRRTVIWGSAAESTRKAEVLAVLLDRAAASIYDVSVPDQPTTSR